MIKKKTFGYMYVHVFLVLLFLGCASNKVQVVEQTVVAVPFSYSDENSRKLAMKSFERIGEMNEDYRVGPEDVLEITIFEWELREATKSIQIRISETGLISLPVIGELNVKGLTVEGIKAKIERQLRERQIIPNPRVTIVLQQYRSKRVAVVGAVRDPGMYTLRKNMTTLLDILSLAGGPDERAGQVAYVIKAIEGGPPRDGTKESLKEIADKAKRLEVEVAPGKTLLVPGKEVIAIDLYDLLERGDMSLNVLVGNGDVVNVPEAKRFHVIGYAKDPGSFALKKPTTVIEGIAMARGINEEEASRTKCALKRKTPDGEIIIPLNLPAIAEGKESNIYLQPDDIIYVRQTRLRRTVLYTYNFLRNIFNIGFSAPLYRY